jgi:hypothetical protein
MSLLPEELWIEILQYSSSLASWCNLYRTSKVFAYMRRYRYLSRAKLYIISYNINATCDGYTYKYNSDATLAQCIAYNNGVIMGSYGTIKDSCSVLLNNHIYVNVEQFELWRIFFDGIVVPKRTVIPAPAIQLLTEDTPGLEFLQHATRYTSDSFSGFDCTITGIHIYTALCIYYLLGCYGNESDIGYSVRHHNICYLDYAPLEQLLWPDKMDDILADAKRYNSQLYKVLRSIVHRPATI